MKKKKYYEAFIDVIELEDSDFIITSPEAQDGGAEDGNETGDDWEE